MRGNFINVMPDPTWDNKIPVPQKKLLTNLSVDGIRLVAKGETSYGSNPLYRISARRLLVRIAEYDRRYKEVAEYCKSGSL